MVVACLTANSQQEVFPPAFTREFGTMRSFSVHKENGCFVIRSDHSAAFIARADSDTDAAAAQRICDAMNIGFRMGYSAGEADTQLALRRVLGME
jgi:hypothetical protein